MNSGGTVWYLIAGYGLTWGVLAWYAWRLERRTRKVRDELATMAVASTSNWDAGERIEIK